MMDDYLIEHEWINEDCKYKVLCLLTHNYARKEDHSIEMESSAFMELYFAVNEPVDFVNSNVTKNQLDAFEIWEFVRIGARRGFEKLESIIEELYRMQKIERS